MGNWDFKECAQASHLFSGPVAIYACSVHFGVSVAEEGVEDFLTVIFRGVPHPVLALEPHRHRTLSLTLV